MALTEKQVREINEVLSAQKACNDALLGIKEANQGGSFGTDVGRSQLAINYAFTDILGRIASGA